MARPHGELHRICHFSAQYRLPIPKITKRTNCHELDLVFASKSRFLSSQGNYSEAIKYGAPLVAIRRRTLTPGHVLTKSSLLELSDSYRNQGDVFFQQSSYPKAIASFERAIALKKEACEDNDRLVADLRVVLVKVLIKQGSVYLEEKQCGWAADSFRRALAISREVFGHHSVNSALLLEAMGDVSAELAERDKAFEWYKEAKTIFDGSVEIDAASLIRLTGKMIYLSQAAYIQAVNFFEEKEFEKALECFEEAFTIKRGTLGEGYSEAAKDHYTSLSVQWRWLNDKKYYENAIHVVTELLPLIKQLYGQNEQSIKKQMSVIAFELNGQAMQLSEQKRLEKAVEHLTLSVEISKEFLDLNDPRLVERMKNLSEITLRQTLPLLEQKKHGIWLENFTKFQRYCKDVFGDNSPHTADIVLTWMKAGEPFVPLKRELEETFVSDPKRHAAGF